MIKRNISLFALALTMGLISCGGNSSESTTNSDSTSSNVRMMDSGMNAGPAQGMGDSTMMNSGNNGASSSANDSVIRRGGGATSNPIDGSGNGGQ